MMAAGCTTIGVDYLEDMKKYTWEKKYNREIVDYLKDNTTYSGYKYEGEYKHIIRPYIKDLIKADLVEKV